MSTGRTEEFHRYHVNHAKTRLVERGDFYHEIVFARDGREQLLILIPSGPSRAVQTAAKAIADSDESDMMSVATLVWIKAFPEEPRGYRLGDVGNYPDKRELLVVVTVDRLGKRLTSVNEIIRKGDGVRLEEREITLPAGMIVSEMTPKKL